MDHVHFLTSQMPQEYAYFFGRFPSPATIVNTSCYFDIICQRADKELKVPAVPSHSVSSDQERSLNEHRTSRRHTREIKDKVPALEEFVIDCQSLDRLIKKISNI